MKKEMVEIQQNAVQNQTAVMIEIGTNLLNQTAEQTRKLTDVEAQVSSEIGNIDWPSQTNTSAKSLPNKTREKQRKREDSGKKDELIRN